MTKSPSSYWQRSQAPLQALIFLLPLILLYEVGLTLLDTKQIQQLLQVGQPVGDIKARRLLFDFFEAVGITGFYLPGLLVIVVLLAWHIVLRDKWTFQPKLYPLMWFESLILALPLFVFGMVVSQLGARFTPTAAVLETHGFAAIVLSIGAGIYEEMLFRLMGLAVVHLIIVDWLKRDEKWGAAAAIGLTALAFALYHFSSENRFAAGKFIFYLAAGVYFAVVYVARGFGIVAWTHALYDVLVVGMQLQYSAEP